MTKHMDSLQEEVESVTSLHDIKGMHATPSIHGTTSTHGAMGPRTKWVPKHMTRHVNPQEVGRPVPPKQWQEHKSTKHKGPQQVGQHLGRQNSQCDTQVTQQLVDKKTIMPQQLATN